MTLVTLYDHTRSRFLSGANAVSDAYIINLYTVLPENATATTKSAAESGATQLTTANGYTQNTKSLASVAVNIASTSNAMFDANDVIWTATGGSLVANYAMVYNDTDTNDPPVFRVDFEAAITATVGINLSIIWDAAGILLLA